MNPLDKLVCNADSTRFPFRTLLRHTVEPTSVFRPTRAQPLRRRGSTLSVSMGNVYCPLSQSVTTPIPRSNEMGEYGICGRNGSVSGFLPFSCKTLRRGLPGGPLVKCFVSEMSCKFCQKALKKRSSKILDCREGELTLSEVRQWSL